MCTDYILHTVNDAVNGAEEADVVGKPLRLIGSRAQDLPDDSVLILHQFLAVEVLSRDSREKSNHVPL